jgi:hypothetical protein
MGSGLAEHANKERAVDERKREHVSQLAEAIGVEGPFTSAAWVFVELQRHLIRNELRMERLFTHFGIEDVTEEEVDAAQYD